MLKVKICLVIISLVFVAGFQTIGDTKELMLSVADVTRLCHRTVPPVNIYLISDSQIIYLQIN
jgi:hypothetical protein